VPRHRRADQRLVRTRPGDGLLQAWLEAHGGAEAELARRLLRAAVALDRVVPGARGTLQQPRSIARQAVDQPGERGDRGLDAARQVVDVAGLAAPRRGDQPLDDVLDVDEVARGDALVLERQRLAVQGLPDEGRD